jgi:hypothetical protein
MVRVCLKIGHTSNDPNGNVFFHGENDDKP